MRALVRLVSAVVLVASAMLVVFAVGMRMRSPVVRDAIRRMNRSYVNPRQHDAGTPGAYASLIRHTGRRTGESYDTPVVAAPTDDGYVIALPYGTRADWLKNVLARGSATIVHEGATVEVDAPEVLPIEAADRHFSAQDQRAHRFFGTHECLVLRRAGDADDAERDQR